MYIYIYVYVYVYYIRHINEAHQAMGQEGKKKRKNGGSTHKISKKQKIKKVRPAKQWGPINK
jgi:uncharacterized C2H2 Zn-finger protein